MSALIVSSVHSTPVDSRVVAQVSPCIAITTRNVSSKCGRSVLWLFSNHSRNPFHTSRISASYVSLCSRTPLLYCFPSRTLSIDPSAITPDSTARSRSPASRNSFPMMDNILQIIWKLPIISNKLSNLSQRSGSLKSNLGVGKSLKLVIPVYLFVGEDVTSKPPPIPINITKPKQGPPTPPKPNTYQGLLVSPLRMVNVAKSPLHVSTSPKSSSCVMPVAMSTHQSFEKGRKGMKMLFVYV
ncbi:hypothetical protein GQR58_015312 [Nymphon striatum]|nr:hypothetical protein GQR58_015312 [Nymphon striatum]